MTPVLMILFYSPLRITFLLWERVEMRHTPRNALRRRVWDSSKACQWAYSPVGQIHLA